MYTHLHLSLSLTLNNTIERRKARLELFRIFAQELSLRSFKLLFFLVGKSNIDEVEVKKLDMRFKASTWECVVWLKAVGKAVKNIKSYELSCVCLLPTICLTISLKAFLFFPSPLSRRSRRFWHANT